MELSEKLRFIPDFPEKGIRFVDITTLLKDGSAFREAIARLSGEFKDRKIDIVTGPESRGFVIGAPVACHLGAGFVPVRKPGKLPAKVLKYEYSLEYGKDTLEIHEDAILQGQQVLVIDDLLATGGTAAATVKMVEALGGEVVGLGFLIELTNLNGRAKLPGYEVVSLIKY